MDKEIKTSEKKNRTAGKEPTRVIVIVAVVFVLLVAFVFFFGNRAFNSAIVEINSAHIDELAEHDVKIINSSISARLNTLQKMADDIAYWNRKDNTEVKDLLYADSEFLEIADKITLVSDDGMVLSNNNVIEKRTDIAEVCAESADQFVCRFDNVVDALPDQRREYLLYGVRIKPVKVEDHTYSYLCCFIRPANLENELKMDLYGGQGFSSVIDNDGNYVLNINRSHSFLDRDNFFADFDSVIDYASVEDFREVLATTTITTTARASAKINSETSEEYYLVFTPMDDVDWYFVSTVPAKVFDAQSRNLMRIAIGLLSIVALALAEMIVFIVRSRRQQHELLEKETTDALNAKLQEQQVALEEALGLAQSANRAKTTFLNNMSHDIRTPMNAIIGFTGLASSHIDNKEQVKDYLGKISQSSEHLLSLINDVLDMSRIESGKMTLDEKNEDMSAILHTLRNMVQADIKNKDLDFFMDCDVDNQFVVCDKLRLNQVLLNILSNSIKYTPAGGAISLRLKQNGVTETGYGKYEFQIKDNGMGMSQEFLKTIFDPFTRVKSSTVSGIQGTGLGMSITKNIVDMMGGTIHIESEENKGTEVTLNFEFKPGEGARKPVKIAELNGLRSLVVDDDMNACKSIAKMLRETGMRSEWCASGKEAIVRTEEAVEIGDLFKVYIIDWLMPDMNGIETARRIRQTVGDQAPIIVLTAYDWSDIEEEAKEAGVTAFVSKPLFPSDLHEVLNQCCGTEINGEEAASEEFDFTGKKILLVEDNEMNREIATEILEEVGLVIDTAEDGTFAVEKMKAAVPGQYDLILMDVQMPLMNGYEATKLIRALPDPAVANIPIIAMTANAFEEDRQEALRAGMNEHVAKPIDIPVLKKTMERFM